MTERAESTVWTSQKEERPQDKTEFYDSLAGQLESLLEDETDVIANLANAASLLFLALSDVNWVGFYLLRQEGLVLGPFQGKPACTRIAAGKGVCGTAVMQDRTLVVDDVHAFVGHIACDSASNSEIVIPIHHAGRAVGVLDVDSPTLARFDERDRCGLEKVVSILERFSDWSTRV